MTPKTARATIVHAYGWYHSRASLAPRTRAEAAPRIVGAYRAYQHLAGPDRAEARAVILHMCKMEQDRKDAALDAWRDHVTMPHHLAAGDRSPHPEAVNVWLRLIERWTPGRTTWDVRHWWKEAYRAHLAYARQAHDERTDYHRDEQHPETPTPSP